MPLERRLEIVEEIIKLCLQFGAHLDEVNGRGQTLADLAESEEMRSLIWQYQSHHINLKCLASRAIVREGIVYEKNVMPFLTNYIKLHDRVKVEG